MTSNAWLRAFVAGLALLAAMAAGSRLGTGAWPDSKALLAQWRGTNADRATTASAPSEAKKILYYRNPMGAPDTSPVPKKDSMGMDYLPVYAEDAPAAPQKKIKYYRNPMGAPDTSPAPKKDSMGMDYIPVYEEGDASSPDDAKTVKISVDKVQRSGVRTAIAGSRKLVLPIRAPGKVMIDERTLRMITLRVDGYIDKLYVNAVGQHVKQGEPLFRLFSQEVLGASSLYQAAMAGSGARSGPAVDGALRKLTNMGVPESHIRRIGTSGVPPAMIEWPSPVSGVVIEKMVIEGERAEPGRALFKIADHTKLWVIADVAEQDADKVRIGSKAVMTFRAMPGELVSGVVSFVYPHLNAETRTAQVRIDLANPDGRFRPDMYADVTIDAGTGDAQVLAVPVDAVVHSGERSVVILDKGEGRFEPREVKLGDSGDGYVAVLSGISSGDKVVTAANFLIDAESNLRAALAAFTAEQKAPELPPSPKPEASIGAANATSVPQ